MYQNIKEKIQWSGRSGRNYKYNVYKMGTKFKRIPANYIIAQSTEMKKWKPIYIGQTEDLNEYFTKYNSMPCMQAQNATHIHVHRNDDGLRARLAEENDLINRWHPECNR